MAQIICKDLVLGYDGHVVCEGVNFRINAGDYMCIVGDNGSGKSTLVKTLLSLKTAMSGEIELGDGLSRRDIGYLPQQSEAQRDFPASVREVVISGCVGGLGKKFFVFSSKFFMAFSRSSFFPTFFTMSSIFPFPYS